MRIGFIGLGRMGSPIAANIRAAGHDVTVHDVRHEAAATHLDAGCSWAESPRALGAGGLVAGMAGGSTWFDLSTNSPSVLKRLHDTFGAGGVEALMVPSAGDRRGAIWHLDPVGRR